MADGMLSRMQQRQRIKRGLIGLIAVGLTTVAGKTYYENQPSQQIAHLLRLNDAPISLKNASCEDWCMTDATVTCAFEIDPRDFGTLLLGWPFKEDAASGGSYSYSGGPKVGRDFQVAVEYSVKPAEFKEGGRVSIVANKARSMVQLDYYEE